MCLEYILIYGSSNCIQSSVMTGFGSFRLNKHSMEGNIYSVFGFVRFHCTSIFKTINTNPMGETQISLDYNWKLQGVYELYWCNDWPLMSIIILYNRSHWIRNNSYFTTFVVDVEQ